MAFFAILRLGPPGVFHIMGDFQLYFNVRIGRSRRLGRYIYAVTNGWPAAGRPSRSMLLAGPTAGAAGTILCKIPK